MSKYVGIKFRETAGQPKKALITEVSEAVKKARAEIEENAKYYNLQWKIDMLTELKRKALALYEEAINEANSINANYEKQIREIEASQYEGGRFNKDDTATLDFELRSLKAELNMTDDKSKVIDRYLASKIGSKAVLMLFADKDIDLGHQAQNIYAKAFVNSKTQAELDFEIKKNEKINNLKLEQANGFNAGQLLAAQRVMQGSIEKGIPTLERKFDDEIEALKRQLDNSEILYRGDKEINYNRPEDTTVNQANINQANIKKGNISTGVRNIGQ